MEASITFKKVGQLINGKTVLAGLSFGIERNSTVAIIGDNDDSGITEFLRLIAGMASPNYGSLFINGLDSIKRQSDIRKFIGYVPFQNDMDPWLTAEQNIRYINNFYKLNEKSSNERFRKLVNDLDLEDKLDVSVNKLSPGVLRKLTLLRELIREPEVLVLDHPTAFMNANDRAITWDLLQSFHNKMTIIYSSSSLNIIEKFHDRILVFHNGTINLDDNLDNMLNQWMGKYQFRIEFEKFLTPLFRKIESIPGIIEPKKVKNILEFNSNERSTLLHVLSKLRDVTIVDINCKRIHLRDLLAARYIDEGVV